MPRPWQLLSAPLAAQFADTTRDYLREYDRDGDGRVSLAEYQDKLSDVFRQMDRNGNGQAALHAAWSGPAAAAGGV